VGKQLIGESTYTRRRRRRFYPKAKYIEYTSYRGVRNQIVVTGGLCVSQLMKAGGGGGGYYCVRVTVETVSCVYTTLQK
jgi:hypothetical protein